MEIQKDDEPFGFKVLKNRLCRFFKETYSLKTAKAVFNE